MYVTPHHYPDEFVYARLHMQFNKRSKKKYVISDLLAQDLSQILSSWLAVAPTMDRVRNSEMEAGRVSATIS